MQQVENEQGGQGSHDSRGKVRASHGIQELTDYEEVEERVAPQAELCREKLQAEAKNTELSGNLRMKKNEDTSPVRGGNYVRWAEIPLKKDYQAGVQQGSRLREAREAAL